MTAPQPGQVWQDRDHRIPADRRRLVEVTAADPSLSGRRTTTGPPSVNPTTHPGRNP